MAAADASRPAGLQQPWRSLFIPLQPTENVIFSSFYTASPPQPSQHAVTFTTPTTACRQWRADTLLVVLDDATIRTYSLASDTAGPTILHQIVPKALGAMLPAASDAAVSENLSMATLGTRHGGSAAGTPTSSTPGGGGKLPAGAAVRATCCTLLPSHLVAPLSADFFHHHPALALRGLPGGSDAAAAQLRGIVGTASGRVEVFGRASYIFGFKAHACPVRAAHIVHVGNFTDAALGHPTADQGSNSGAAGSSLMSRSAASSATRKYLDDACATGFVTMGEDGHVFVWRRRNAQDGYEAASLRQPGLLSKCCAVAVAQPTWDVAAPSLQLAVHSQIPPPSSAAPSPTAAAAAAASHSAALMLGTSGGGNPVGIAASGPPALPFPVSLVILGANGYDDGLAVASVDALQRTEPEVAIPGSFARMSAVATEGSTVLVAREKIVYAVCYAPRMVHRLLTTNTTVLQLEISKPLAVAGCRSGKVLVFGVATGVVLGAYSTYNQSPVRCLALHYHAMLLALVDDTGAVELLELPSEYLRHGEAPGTMASVQLLQRLVKLEESSSGEGAMTTARRAVGEESLLLARLAIPHVLERYLGAQHALL